MYSRDPENRSYQYHTKRIKNISRGFIFFHFCLSGVKEQLFQIEELQFLFISSTFLTEKEKQEMREFYIPRLHREKSLYGAEYEIKPRNELTQKAVARECAEWVKKKLLSNKFYV